MVRNRLPSAVTRLFTAPRGCSPRCAGVWRSPRKRQPSKRRLTPIVPTHETAFSPVAKKAAKGNIRQPQIFYVRENSQRRLKDKSPNTTVPATDFDRLRKELSLSSTTSSSGEGNCSVDHHAVAFLSRLRVGRQYFSGCSISESCPAIDERHR